MPSKAQASPTGPVGVGAGAGGWCPPWWLPLSPLRQCALHAASLSRAPGPST
jgi:hypothetical protein